jgi:RNA polymerase sigma-70 factor (ECF subfamily)
VRFVCGGKLSVKDYLMGKWDELAPWESQVLAALVANDFQRAIEALVLGYQHAIVGYCTNMLAGATPAEVEEVAQDVFLAAYKALPSFQQQASIRTWVFAIARNRCVTYRTRAQRQWHKAADHREAVADAVHPNPPVSPEVGLLEAAQEVREENQRVLVAQSLQRLNKQPRDLLMMYYYAELSIADIAKKLWVSETTIRRRLRTAEQQLKHMMATVGRELVNHDA